MQILTRWRNATSEMWRYTLEKSWKRVLVRDFRDEIMAYYQERVHWHCVVMCNLFFSKLCGLLSQKHWKNATNNICTTLHWCTLLLKPRSWVMSFKAWLYQLYSIPLFSLTQNDEGIAHLRDREIDLKSCSSINLPIQYCLTNWFHSLGLTKLNA